MEHGLAHQMVYGDGSGQSTKHNYGGVLLNKKRKNSKNLHKRRKKVAK